MVTTPEVTRTISSYQSAVGQTRSRVEEYVTRLWGSMASFRGADIDRMVRTVVPVVVGAQQRVAVLTDSYLSAVATAQGFPRPAMGVRLVEVTGAAVRGVDPEEVYRRPGVTVWTALSRGESLQSAVSRGRNRLLQLTQTDIQLARTHTQRWASSRDDSVVGHRRVLTGEENCALCVIASTQRYHRGDLMPIHSTCDCGVAEIRGDQDPGQVLDRDRLEQLYDAARDQLEAADRSGRGYGGLQVRYHGEQGPVLTWKNQAFTGPGDVE